MPPRRAVLLAERGDARPGLSIDLDRDIRETTDDAAGQPCIPVEGLHVGR